MSARDRSASGRREVHDRPDRQGPKWLHLAGSAGMFGPWETTIEDPDAKGSANALVHPDEALASEAGIPRTPTPIARRPTNAANGRAKLRILPSSADSAGRQPRCLHKDQRRSDGPAVRPKSRSRLIRLPEEHQLVDLIVVDGTCMDMWPAIHSVRRVARA